jgi:ketosteroid isomerase-like protein
MKNLLYTLILTMVASLSATNLSAQGKPVKLPMENKASFEKFLKEVYDAYDRKDYKALKNTYYDSRAGEINPDGSMIQGVKNLDIAWKGFDAMVDTKPTFTYQLTSSRMVDNEIGIITWNTDANIMVKGKQMGGKAIGMAVVKKKNESWQIQFDVLTPVIPMPPAPAPMMMEKKEEMMPDTSGH